MVKNRYPRMRVSPEFLNLAEVMKKNIEPSVGRRVTMPDITRYLTRIMEEEKTTERSIRRAKFRRGLY